MSISISESSANPSWLELASKRVTDHSGLELMAQKTYELSYSASQVWDVIEDINHWQADAFHNSFTQVQNDNEVGSHFHMSHTNHPIIPWKMDDQEFVGVITQYNPSVSQAVAEINIDESSGSRRTPDHQQLIELKEAENGKTQVRFSVSTVRMEGLNPVIRFFFRPWARYQLRVAIDKKMSHIQADLEKSYPS